MPSTLAQTATILAVGRKPSSESRVFSALDRAACAATATKVDGIGRLPTVRAIVAKPDANAPAADLRSVLGKIVVTPFPCAACVEHVASR